MVQKVRKWGQPEVDLDPSLGCVHLGYNPMHATIHCVVWMVLLGHCSDVRHEMSGRQ